MNLKDQVLTRGSLVYSHSSKSKGVQGTRPLFKIQNKCKVTIKRYGLCSSNFPRELLSIVIGMGFFIAYFDNSIIPLCFFSPFSMFCTKYYLKKLLQVQNLLQESMSDFCKNICCDDFYSTKK